MNCKEIQPVNPKGNQPWIHIWRTDAEAKAPILLPPEVKSWLTGKTLTEKGWKQEEKGTTQDEMVGWHHRLDGHEFEQAPGVGDGQGGLACCSPWGRKESDMSEQLNWTELKRQKTKGNTWSSRCCPFPSSSPAILFSDPYTLAILTCFFQFTPCFLILLVHSFSLKQCNCPFYNSCNNYFINFDRFDKVYTEVFLFMCYILSTLLDFNPLEILTAFWILYGTYKCLLNWIKFP